MGIALWTVAGVATWSLAAVLTAYFIGHAATIAGGPRHLLSQEATTVAAENFTGCTANDNGGGINVPSAT